MSNEINMLIHVAISDIHFGALDAERLYEELKKEFLNKLKKLPRIDLITINGDLYHRIISLNDLDAYYSFKFWDKLKKISKKKNCKFIRVIKGTMSHDVNQLDNLPLDDDIDIKIIDQVESEVLFDRYRVLYLPEEYIKNPKEYYEEYFNKEYDLIVGHGQFEETSFINFDSETTMEAAPVYDAKLFLNICKGPIIFGHIHDAIILKKRIFYTGSFTRWKMGEERPKGFLINIQDLNNTENFTIVPCENKMARKYVTIDITEYLEKYQVEKIINLINEYMVNNNIYKIRLKASDNNSATTMAKLTTIHSHYMGNKQVQMDIKTLQINDETEEEKELVDKYSYLSEDIPNEEKISRFAKDRFDYELSAERVNELLTCDILKLLDSID